MHLRKITGALVLAALGAGRGGADEPAQRTAVAKCVTPTGSILRREAPDKPWQLVKEGETLYSGDLLLGMSGAALDGRDGAVRLTFVSDPTGSSPLPILETAVVLGNSKDVDFDFFLERGRVDFANQKNKEQARVRARIRKDGAGAVIVAEPGAQASLSVLGRWPAGVPFVKKPKPDHAPALSLIFLVLKGEVGIHLDGRYFAMAAPPGPAFVAWDSIGGGDRTPQRLEKLPDWVHTEGNPEAVKRKQILGEFRQLVLTKDLGAALDEFAVSNDSLKRRLAVYAMGALDDLKRLGTVLASAKHADTWDHAVRAMRHWIGRGPDQDLRLYNALIKEANFTERDAESVLQLLHSFGEDQLSRPELYEVLIDFLDHDKLALRGLAHWHLVRLVPAGRKIAYNPTDSKEARAKAIEQWKELIPPGKLPPSPKVEDK